MKKILTVCLILSLLCGMAACGSSSAQNDTAAVVNGTAVDGASAERTAQEWLTYLKSQLPFDDQMRDTDQAPAIYGILDEDGYTGESAMYISTAATPEEIAVFEVDDAYSVRGLCELAQSHIEQQKQQYASYAPGEVPKLESAVIRVCGNYVIVVVCANNELASQLLDTAQ